MALRSLRPAAASKLVMAPPAAGVGVDYYLWSIEISGVGTLLAGINLITTVLADRSSQPKRTQCGARPPLQGAAANFPP
jgi:hypothetical protein